VSSRDVISDELWERIKPLLPSLAPQRGGRWRDQRVILEGIAWRFRTGSPWRDLPERFGPWQTVYDRHNLWSENGTYAVLFRHLLAEADADGELDWLVRSTPRSCGRTSTPRAHAGRTRAGSSSTQGARSSYKHRAAEPSDHGLGRSRGGWTTKTHLACECKGRPLSMVVTAGNINDTTMLSGQCWTPSSSHATDDPAGLASAPTGSWPTRATAPGPTATCCAAEASRTPSPNRRTRRPTGRAAGAKADDRSASTGTPTATRNTVERCFNRLKQWRVAMRSDKHAQNYEGGLLLASLVLRGRA